MEKVAHNKCGHNIHIKVAANEEGTKHDNDKLRLDLIPADTEEEVARVYTFGANKYGDRNWEKGLMYHRPYGAARRHISAWWRGDDLDKETNIHHLAHAICELQFLLAFELRNMKHLDDRPLQREEPCDEDKTI